MGFNEDSPHDINTMVIISMLLIIAPFFILLCLVVVYKIDNEHITAVERNLLCIVLGVCFFVYTFFSIRINILYLSPHRPWKTRSESKITNQLMDCAREYITSVTPEYWNKIQTCMQNVEHYQLSKGQTPYTAVIPVAFVYNMDKNSVFTTIYYDKLSDIDKAIVMVHECSHIAVGTVDHAYVWENKYITLSHAQHLHNADSYAQAVAHKCTDNSYIM